jgi:hypothetical protein
MCLSGSLTFEGESFSLQAIAVDDEAVEIESAKKISTPSTLAQRGTLKEIPPFLGKIPVGDYSPMEKKAQAWTYDDADDVSDNGYVERDRNFSQQVGCLDEEMIAALEKQFDIGSPNKHK